MAKQVVSFISKFTELELVRQPSNDVPVASGIGWVSQTKGVRYKFYPTLAEDGSGLVGRLDVSVGQDKMLDTSGWLAPDADSSVERDAPSALRVHKEFGQGRDFWQMPTPAATVRRTLTRAGIALDVETVLNLIEEERGVGNRADLLREAQDVLDGIEQEKASMQAKAEAEAQEPAPKAKAKAKAKPKAAAAA